MRRWIMKLYFLLHAITTSISLSSTYPHRRQTLDWITMIHISSLSMEQEWECTLKDTIDPSVFLPPFLPTVGCIFCAMQLDLVWQFTKKNIMYPFFLLPPSPISPPPFFSPCPLLLTPFSVALSLIQFLIWFKRTRKQGCSWACSAKWRVTKKEAKQASFDAVFRAIPVVVLKWPIETG